jgi:uncharacterized membrane protein YqjE
VERRPSHPPGFLDSLKELGDGLLGMLRERAELLTIELQEEKYRFIQIFIWISAAVFTAVLAVVFVSLTIVYIFWETARLAALGGLAAFYVIALIVIVVTFKRYLARQPRPFSSTLQALEEDRACIRTEN